MYLGIIAVAAVALYALLASLAAAVTDFHDLFNPQSLGANTRLILDFSHSQVEQRDALTVLAELNERDGLGLLKRAPDLDRTGAQVFADLEAHEDPERVVGWFGDHASAQIVGIERLAHSSPDGTYLVTSSGDVDRTVASLMEQGVVVERIDASTWDSITHLAQQAGFAAPLIAAGTLIMTVTVFWLAVRARSRALRVLAGAAPWRIHAKDLGALLGVLFATAIGTALLAASLVGITRGWLYVPLFATVLVTFQGLALAGAVLVSVLLSTAAWPSVEIIARRLPAVKSLRGPAQVVQIATLVALLAYAGPAWAAVVEAHRTATQLAVWNELSDQVTLTYGSLGEEDLDTVAPQIAGLVRAAEAQHGAALSYAITEEQHDGDFEGFTAIALVNRQWVALIERTLGADALDPVPSEGVSDMLKRELGPSLEVWSPEREGGAGILSGLSLYTPASAATFPVIDGGAAGQLSFPPHLLVIEVPSVSSVFDPSNTVSLTTSGNIVFTGVAATQRLLDAAGLSSDGLARLGIDGGIRPRYVAEEGILQAQFAAYLSSLLAISLVALSVAFVVAAGVTAMVSGLLHARRDFPLRLSGTSWEAVVRSRAARDLGVAAAITLVLVLSQPAATVAATTLAGILAMLTIYLAHVVAAREAFRRVVRREL